MSKLTGYNKKRDFKKTSEPKGELDLTAGFRFVVQRHEASRLHYDFRLELDGVLKSWAVPKGPSMNGSDKRLAMQVEDHPVSYLSFKGTIPEGNYGAGKMMIWDKGVFFPVNKDHDKITEKEALKAMKAGDFKVLLNGKKLKGEFVLVKLKKTDNAWLLIKHKDEYAVDKPYDSETFVSNKRVANKKSNNKKRPVKKLSD